jgi:hypothetical protein
LRVRRRKKERSDGAAGTVKQKQTHILTDLYTVGTCEIVDILNMTEDVAQW